MARKTKRVPQAEVEFQEDLKAYIADVRMSVKALTRLVNLRSRELQNSVPVAVNGNRNGGPQRS
jgi:hypothetical protein